MTTDLGPTYTKGSSYRARAEARQRHYRAEQLAVGWRKWGHRLDPAAAAAGANFVVPLAHEAARRRREAGKGVADNTFENMLASQAMCFNVFAPLAHDTDLATRALREVVPGLVRVDGVHIEHTPANEIFGDQTGISGVDCDVLVEAGWSDGRRAIVTVETKLVEPSFSTCSFRQPRRVEEGKTICPSDLLLAPAASNCLYVSQKHYRYWEWTRRLGTVRESAQRAACPFGGSLWQLWVNHTLAAAEASRRGAAHAVFAVCAPAQNDALLDGGRVLDGFRELLVDPATLLFIPIDGLIDAIARVCKPTQAEWAQRLAARYARI